MSFEAPTPTAGPEDFDPLTFVLTEQEIAEFEIVKPRIWAKIVEELDL